MSAQKRQALLGRSWSVPVIQYLIEPLTAYYPTMNTTTNGAKPPTQQAQTPLPRWSTQQGSGGEMNSVSRLEELNGDMEGEEEHSESDVEVDVCSIDESDDSWYGM